jgi:hypothetical protein
MRLRGTLHAPRVFFNHRVKEVKGEKAASLNLPSSVVNYLLPKEAS